MDRPLREIAQRGVLPVAPCLATGPLSSHFSGTNQRVTIFLRQPRSLKVPWPGTLSRADMSSRMHLTQTTWLAAADLWGRAKFSPITRQIHAMGGLRPTKSFAKASRLVGSPTRRVLCLINSHASPIACRLAFGSKIPPIPSNDSVYDEYDHRNRARVLPVPKNPLRSPRKGSPPHPGIPILGMGATKPRLCLPLARSCARFPKPRADPA